MARRDGNKPFNRRNNRKGTHQRRRTTRGHRMMSKFKKYKYYEEGGGTMSRLPTVKIGDKNYFVDSRLGELRNVDNPHDIKVLTCRDCIQADFCNHVNEPHNIDGNCVIDK